MSLPHILLGLLHRPASGYDVKKEFDGSLRNFWRAELSQIYPQLAKLQKRGLLVSTAVESDKGPPRNVYEITRAGRDEFRRWLEQGPSVGKERIAYLAQTYFLARLDDDDARIAFLGRLKAYSEDWLAALRGIEAAWSADDPRYPDDLPDDDFYPQLTLDFGMRRVAVTVDWCRDSIRRIDARRIR
ncbi:MAG: PadR family transcriptional regulator [Woeseiaceae bacterium]|nr:PadR family transcriptional regulator [Woeseiaceae bacterium]